MVIPSEFNLGFRTLNKTSVTIPEINIRTSTSFQSVTISTPHIKKNTTTSDAKEIMKIYDEEGIDGIENPELKQRLIEWEADWANK